MFQLCRNQPLEEKVKELEETLQAKNSEISRLTTNLENLQIKNEELESKNHELEKTIQTQNDSFAKLEVKVEDLEDKNVDLNKTLEEQNNTNPHDWATIEQAKQWTKSYNFSVISFNATLNTKIASIKNLVQDINPTLVIVSEIGRPKWAIDEECPFLINGYIGPFHSGKRIEDKQNKNYIIEASQKQSNGVAIWVRKDDSFVEGTTRNVTEDLKIPGGSASKEMNYCVLAINSKLPNMDQLMVVGLYKSPTTNFKSFREKFSNLVHKLQDPKGILITGDINFNILDADDEEATNYKEMTSNVHSLIQHIQKPTRISTTKNSCLDHIMTNFEVEVADVLDHNVSDQQVTIAAWNHH